MATVTKRGDSYRITASCGYNAHGRQVRKSMTWTPDLKMTERQIKKELERQKVLFDEKCQGTIETNGNIKFELLAEEFLEYIEKNKLLKIRTIDSLKDKKDRVYLAIGHLRVDKITSRQIQQFINNLSEPGINKRYPDRGLSSKTQKGYLGFISDVFNYAIQFQIASYNPCHNIRIKSSEHEEQKIYTLEEAQNFLKLLEDTAPIKYKVFFSIALFTGLRRGEILGLEWKDIDFDTGVVSVRRTSLYTKDTGIYTDTPKTKRSERCFKVSEDMLCLFRSFKADQAEKRLALGDKWIDNDRLFTSWNGDPMGVDSARHWLTKFCKHNEIRYVNVHSFRHPYVKL